MRVLDCNTLVAQRQLKKELNILGITNNEVKFLVTLDIDEDKSKKKIDTFLSKITKEQKITFGVNVGKSNENIKAFLDKQQNKKINLNFDVAVGVSKRNIQTFLNNQEQSRKSIIFYVNEQASKVTINSALKKINTDPLQIEISVDHEKSKTNINTFLNKQKQFTKDILFKADEKESKTLLNNAINSIKINPKQIELSVNKEKSKENINKFLESASIKKAPIELSLARKDSINNINESLKKIVFAKAQVKLGLVSGAFNEIKEIVEKKEFSGLKIVGELDVAKTKERITEQINKMKLPKFKVDVVANVNPVVSSETVKSTVKNSPSNESQEKVYSGNQSQVIKQIKEEYKQLGQTVETFNKSVAEGQELFIKRLKRQGNQLDIVRDAQTKEITKITATYKNSANEIQKTVYTPLIAKYKDLNATVGEGTKEVRGFVAQVEKIKNTETFNLKRGIEEFNKKLVEAQYNSTILARDFDKFSKQAQKATSNNDLDRLNRQLEEAQSKMVKRNQLEKAQLNLISQREQQLANLTRIEKMYLRTVDKAEAQKIKDLLSSSSITKVTNASPQELFKFNLHDINQAQTAITKVRSQIKQLNADATEATKNSMGIISSLKVAMEKFPIWMVASTAFYGSIRTLREFGSIIVDIDTKMTDLKKVMSQDTDFGKVFEDATAQAKEFGQTISSTLDAYSLFAKQGFKGDELNELAQAGLVAGNVGDIETGKASEYLTASLLQWNKQTSEAMSIVDSWNEISNNYATTVENLAQGQAKAGATAKALGLDFNELNAVIGTLNARTKQSGNEIGNFIKSTFPNLISDKGQSILSSLGVALEDGEGNLRNIMDIYKDVAKEYQKLSQAEKNQVTLGLGGKYHISRLQTLLDDLASVDSMYDQMLESSQNSANSAMNENETYMQSLQARINLARVEVEKLALAIGDAVMTDSMIAGLQAFSSILSFITTLVGKIGVLPATFIGIVTTLTLFSNRFGDLIDKLGKGRISVANLTTAFKNLGKVTVPQLVTIDAETGKLKQNTAETNKNATAKNGLSKASRFLSMGFGAVGVASIAVGYAIEKLVGWYGEAKKAKEELKAKNEQELKSYSDNEQSVNKLIAKYQELSFESKRLASSNSELSAEQYQELLDVQNQLGDILPDLVKGEDEYGNKVLISSEQAKTKVEILKQELELQKQLNEEKAKEEQEEAEDTAKDTIKDAEKDKKNNLRHAYNYVHQMELVSKNYQELRDEFTKGINIKGDAWYDTKSLKSIDDVALAIERVKDALSRKTELNLTDGAISKLESTKTGLEQIYLELLQGQKDVMSGLNVLKTGYVTNLNDLIKTQGNFSEDSQEIFEDVANSVINLAETEGQLEKFDEAITIALSSKDNDLEKQFNELSSTITKMKDSGITDAKQLEAEFGEKLRSIKDSILEVLKGAGIKENSAIYKTFSSILDNLIVSSLDYEKEIGNIMKAQKVGREEAEEYFRTHSDGTEVFAESTDAMTEYVESIKNFNSLGEQMLGVNSKLVDETNELIQIYNYLSNVTDRTTEETNTMNEAMKRLQALYPHLVKSGELRIENVKLENKMNEVLLESYDNLADAKYSAEEEQTYYSAVGTKNRIENLKLELKSLETVMEQYRKHDLDTNKKIMDKVNRGELSIQMALPMMADIYEYNSKMSELEKATSSLNTQLNKLSGTNSSLSQSTSSSSASTSEAQKVTDKYTLSLKKLDTALKEIQAKQKKYPTYSKQYRQALEEENKIIKQQIELNNQKAKDLGGVSASSASYTTFGTVTPKGWSGQITSGFGKRGSSNHIGIDIDGAIGDILEANVAGKVIQKGYDKISGNYITVQDSNGLKHFYAHLDSITVALNDVVKVGTKLGTIGNTGNVIAGAGGDGSHLHYGVKQGNTWIDPSKYVQQAKSGIQSYSTSSASASGGSIQSTVWNYFKSKGLSDKAVAGIMGNIQQESTFNPSAVNKKSGASGLLQWLGSRKTALQNYAKSLGKSWTDVQVQLDFAWKELNSSEKKSLASLQRNDLTASQHASQFEALFERSGGSEVAKRQTYANQYYNQYSGTSGAVSYSSYSGGNSDVLADIEALKQENIALAEQLQENYYKGIKSRLEEYQRNRDIEDIGIAKQEELQKNLLTYTKEYEDSVNKQYTAEQRKLKSYQDEYAYIQKVYDAGGLTLAQQDELIDRRYELQKLMLESQNQIKEYYNTVISGRLSRYDKEMEDYAKTLEWEEAKIQSVDKQSKRYIATLQIMANARKGQADVIKKEIEYVNKMLKAGNLTSSMYEELTERANALKIELIEVNEALHDVNYEMIMTKVSLADEDIDDIDFEISKSQAYAGLYEDGSADQKRELEFQLTKLEEKLALLQKRGQDIQADMSKSDLGHKQLQELEELLEENTLAFLEVQKAIQDTKKELEDFNKIIDDQIKDKREDLADEIISALKDAIEEAKDIQLDAIDELIEAEEERHEKVIEQYDKELEAYTKIIDAKRREISDEDRDRTYNNKLEELNTQKQELQNKLNLLSNVNTYEGKKEKEELEKQIAEIEKQINEEKYQYEKDLREQQLDDLLDEKTEHIEDLKEKEDEYSKDVLDTLNKQKEYWEKYYKDLLNDEKYFAKMREDILKGNFAEVEAQFGEHIKKLTDSLPELEDRFDGTWKAVGTSIRENVINKMKDLLAEIKVVEEEVKRLESLKDKVTGNMGSSTGGKQDATDIGDKGKLSEADMQVILAKFMKEQLASSLDPQGDAIRIQNIKDKADTLANQGRENGSTIAKNDSFESIIDRLSPDQLKTLGSYFSSNASDSNFITKEYIDYIKNYGDIMQRGKTLNEGDKMVMFAKYMWSRASELPNSTERDKLRAYAENVAEQGRKKGSFISPDVTIEYIENGLSNTQKFELGQYLLDNAKHVPNSFISSVVSEHGERLKLAYDSLYKTAKLDSGGYTGEFGSTGGVDGKGGKFAVLHQREIVLNPLDTERMLKISSIMDNVMRTINGAIALPTLPKLQTNNTPSTTDNSTAIHINIERMNGTQSDIDNLAKQIQNRLLREKGKR